MANTDWPGHEKTNHHQQHPPSPGAEYWFTQGQQPPWAYFVEPSGGSSPTGWEFLDSEHYVGSAFREFLARWIRSVTVVGIVQQIILTFNTEGVPHTIHVKLTVAFSFGVQLSICENVLDTGLAEGTFLTRDNVWTFPSSGWANLENSPFDYGCPDADFVLTPVDCIPGWKYKDPMP